MKMLMTAISLILLAGAVAAQPTVAPDLAKFLPGKWIGPSGKFAVELDGVKEDVVTGKLLDIDGRDYPIGATWTKGRSASGRFDKGVFHLTMPSGNKMELALSPDGSTLSGSRQVVERNSYDPSQNLVTLKRK